MTLTGFLTFLETNNSDEDVCPPRTRAQERLYTVGLIRRFIAENVDGVEIGAKAEGNNPYTGIECAGCMKNIPLTVLCDTCAAKRS